MFVTDAVTGKILYQESRILHADVEGNVSGLVTEGAGADICEEEILMPLPYTRVNIGGTQSFADDMGDFVIPNGGNSEVTVQSPLRGEWFVVSNAAGAETVLSLNVVPPGPANFVHNALNNSDDADLLVVADVDLSVAKTVDDATPNEQDQVVYTITVTNTSGSVGASSVELMDSLPAGITYVCVSVPPLSAR